MNRSTLLSRRTQTCGLALWAACLLVVAWAQPAFAQAAGGTAAEAEPTGAADVDDADDDDDEFDADDDTADSQSGRDSAGRGDEFDESISSGRPHEEILADDERAQRAARQDAEWIDTVERGRDSALQLFLGVGAALPSSLDAGLRSHMYGDSAVFFHGDVSVLGRVAEWLHIGGRLGGRGRGWGRRSAEPAIASGMDVMVVAHARAYVGRVVDLGAALGAGLGFAGLAIEGNTSMGLAPRLHGSLLVGFRVATGVRLITRFAWDYFPWFDLDRFGHDLELGGPSLSLGLEVRP